MAHYLVTGAAGFIASKVIQILLEQGHTVIGVDNLNDAYDVRIKDYRLKSLLPLSGFTFYKMDISSKEDVQKLIADSNSFDAVINLAARAGVRLSLLNPWAFVETNVTGTLNLLELCRQKGVGKFILASTSSLYGKHNPLPYNEDTDTNRPLSPYAASKKGAEALCYTYHHIYDLDVTIFRYFTVYGPAGRPDMSMFRFTKWICEGQAVELFGDGSQSRDFTYVDDIARGTVLGLKPLGYEIINLGNDHPHALMEALNLIEARLGRKAIINYKPFQKADVPATRACIDKAERLLGWQPAINLEEGVARMVDWYLAERSWASQIET